MCACVLGRFSRVLPSVHCNLMDCRLPASSLHGILQARILEWVAIAHDPSIPFFGIYLKKMKTLIQKISIPVFTAVLFRLAKIGKQSKCLSINEWIKKIHTHTQKHTLEYYSTIKKEGKSCHLHKDRWILRALGYLK